ncbi:MAG: GGDEF domain-containing response regulator [Desulfobulbaceae bacterium]|nr:GGDEF domain-containing response regulator [Desulfobulbaceae bacterium]
MDELNVLFVDDEIFTLHALKRLLKKETYGKYFAESGAEALKIIEATPIHIVVSDMKMPEMDGLTLLRIIKEKFPDIIRIVLSANTQTAQLLPCINTGEIFRFITKPLEKEKLKTAIHDAIELFLVRQDKVDLVRSLQQKNDELQESLTRQKEVEYKLQLLCMVDDLTGLYNRRQLITALQQAFFESKRYDTSLSCMMVDLDHFKIVNDTYGHDFGDAVLKEFSKRLKNVLRTADISFRYGGEEFFALLPQTELDEAEIVGQRILESCRSTPFASGDISHDVTVSIGAASYKSCLPHSPEELIKAADEMLYQAKNLGRDRVVKFI